METITAMMRGSITISQTQKRYWHGGILSRTPVEHERIERGRKDWGNKQKKPGQPDMADGCLPAYLLWRKTPLRGQETRLFSWSSCQF